MDAFLSAYHPRTDRTVIIFPPAVSLPVVAAGVAGRSDVLPGIQNIHWAEKGAFTGEISAGIARDAGARVALVGHSERRHLFGDTDAQCAKRCAAAAKAHLPFMLCVGETIHQRAVARRSLANRQSYLDGVPSRIRAGVGDRNGPYRLARRCFRDTDTHTIRAAANDRHQGGRDPDLVWRKRQPGKCGEPPRCRRRRWAARWGRQCRTSFVARHRADLTRFLSKLILKDCTEL